MQSIDSIKTTASRICGSLLFLIQFVFEPQIICDHRDKLAICGLSSIVLNGISKVTIQRIHVASVPRDLDRVADSISNQLASSLLFLTKLCSVDTYYHKRIGVVKR